STEIGGAKTTFDKLVEKELKRIAQKKIEAKAAEEAEKITAKAERSWKSIALSTREAAGNITRITGQLLKWGSISGVLSGLAGLGGLWGLDRLGASVGGQSRSATGLGIGYCAQSAFNINFGRLFNTQAFLSGVSTALGTAGGRTALYGAGLREGDIRG